MDCFERKPTLRTRRLTIRPMRESDAPALLASTEEPESRRLTGTHHRFTLEQIEAWCSSRDEQHDRWDLVIEDAADGTWLGELAVNGWIPTTDPAESASRSNRTLAATASDPRR